MIGLARDNDAHSERLFNLDILRAIAILVIVICHLYYAVPQFRENAAILSFLIAIGNCGLALFVFLSGYSLMIKRREFNSLADVRSYLYKRFLKLYPLYWLGLLILYITQALHLMDFGSWGVQLVGSDGLQMLVYFLGLQIIFANLLFTPEGLVYWFVSAIMIFYFLFPLLLYCAQRLQGSFARSMLLVSLFVFVVLLAITLVYSGIDSRLYAFYWFFIAGIILGRSSDLNNVKGKALVGAATLFAIGFILTNQLDNMFEPFEPIIENSLPANVSEAFDTIAIIFYGAAGAVLAIYLSNRLQGYLTGWPRKFVQRIALSTYSIYIFHYYLLLFAASLVLSIDRALIPIVVIVLGIPLAILIPPYIQDFVDYAMMFPSRKARNQSPER